MAVAYERVLLNGQRHERPLQDSVAEDGWCAQPPSKAQTIAPGKDAAITTALIDVLVDVLGGLSPPHSRSHTKFHQRRASPDGVGNFRREED
jgi:hypothetical protein